jgi:hypothetical protein
LKHESPNSTRPSPSLTPQRLGRFAALEGLLARVAGELALREHLQRLHPLKHPAGIRVIASAIECNCPHFTNN